MQSFNPTKAIILHVFLLALITVTTVLFSFVCIHDKNYWNIGIFAVFLVTNFWFNIKGIRLALQIKKLSAKQAALDDVEALIRIDEQEGNEEALREHIVQAQHLAKELQVSIITSEQKKKK